jgi:hypothetical protein
MSTDSVWPYIAHSPVYQDLEEILKSRTPPGAISEIPPEWKEAANKILRASGKKGRELALNLIHGYVPRSKLKQMFGLGKKGGSIEDAFADLLGIKSQHIINLFPEEYVKILKNGGD